MGMAIPIRDRLPPPHCRDRAPHLGGRDGEVYGAELRPDGMRRGIIILIYLIHCILASCSIPLDRACCL